MPTNTAGNLRHPATAGATQTVTITSDDADAKHGLQTRPS